MTVFDVCVCGSVNADLVFHVKELPKPGETVESLHHEVRPGGKGANQAVASSRFGSAVCFVGRCGDDEYGGLARTSLEAAGINIETLVVGEGATGMAAVVVAEDAENSIVIAPGQNAMVDSAGSWPVGKVWITQAEVPVAAIEQALRAARSQGALAILNPSPAGIIPPALIREFDLVIVNESEYDEISECMPPLVIRTEGAGGASILPSGTTIPAFAVEAADSTGAGDVFVGAIAAALAMGDELEDAARLAMAAASIAVSEGRGQDGYPSRARAESLMVAAGSEKSSWKEHPRG
jgi:ribokinase